MLSINGESMPTPQSMTVTFKAIGKQETSASGGTLFDRLSVKRILQCAWGYLTGEAAALLLSAALDNVFFQLAYTDPVSASVKTGTFRAAASSLGVHRVVAGVTVGYTSVSMTFEER